jgi:hypothetical protein
MASQNPGDKSTELSVRTQDMLEEMREDEDEEDDDDLSEQMSYDDNDASVFNDTTADHVDDNEDDDNDNEDEDDDSLMFGEEETVGDDAAQVSDDYSMPTEDQSVASQDSTVRDIDGAPRPEENGVARNLAEAAPQDYRVSAHGTLHDLIDVFGARSQVSSDQYERSLRQLHAKWESVLEQTVFEHEQSLDSVLQERHDTELDIEELRRSHEIELEASKAAVLSQSQKIILEEMKLNADQEVKACKSEEAVETAVEEARQEMSEDFEIALEGMKTTQEEMKIRYEKLVKDTEVRVRDEVENEIEKSYTIKMDSFKEIHEELKKQLLEQTLEIQTLEMKTGMSEETEELMKSLENEVRVLYNTINVTKIQHQEQFQRLKAEVEASGDASAGEIDQDTLTKAVEAAKSKVRIDMTDEFDIVLSRMKENSEELIFNNEELVKATEIRVRNEVFAEAKKEAGRIVQATEEQYSEVKAQIIDLAIQVEKLEFDVDTKTSEIEVLGGSLEKSESQVDVLTTQITSKNSEVAKLTSDLESKSSIIIQLGAELEAKSSKCVFVLEANGKMITELESLSNTYELKLHDLCKAKNEEIQVLGSEVSTNLELVSKLETLVSMKEGQVKKLNDDMESINSMNGSKNIELVDRAATLKTMLNAKEKDVLTLEGKINQLGIEMTVLNKTLRKKDKLLQKNMTVMKSHIEELNANLKTKDEGIKELLSEMDSVEGNIKILGNELEEKNKLLETESEITKTLRNSVAEKDIMLVTNEEEIATMAAVVKDLEKGKGTSRADFETIQFDYDMKLQDALDQHQDKLADLEANAINNKKAQDKCNAEIRVLHERVEEERARIVVAATKHDEILAAAEWRYKDEIERLKKKQKVDMAELSQNTVVHEDSRSVQSENESTSSSKRSTTRKMIPTDVPKRKKLILERPLLDPPVHNIGAASRVPQSPGYSLENIIEGQEMTPDIVYTPEKAPSIKADDGLVSPLTMTSPLAKGKQMKRASRSTASVSRTPTRIPKSVDTNDRRKRLDNIVRTLPTKNSKSTASLSRTPKRIPITIESNANKKRHGKTSLDSSRSVRTLPTKISRNTRRTPASSSSSVRHPRTTHTTMSSRLQSFASPQRSSSGSVTRSVRNTNNKIPTPSRVRHSDLDSVQMRSREGLFSCESTLPLFGEIKLLIINVPITDRRKKMAKALNIEIVNNPLECTHSIVGDADNHIRRTAKLMAALCVTPNILRSEWLDDCYNHRLIMSTHHHTLLNDYLAEKAYAFSMKKTIIEGIERRKYAGLFNGWRIMVCDDVAGNKAPKEADLKMMVAAAGGEWLESSNVPVPLVEDPIHVIVITSDPATSDQLQNEKSKIAATNGAGFFTIAWLFDSLMHQKLFGIKRGLGH